MSDNKALALQDASDAIKMLGSLQRNDCPKWTEGLEASLSKLPIHDISNIAGLCRVLDAGIQRDMLPS